MAKVTIESEGVGVIYQKDNIWKVLYPFGNGHNINVKYKKVGDENFTDLGDFGRPNTKLEITTSHANANATKGVNFNTLLDLSKYHNGLKLKNDWSQKATLLEVHNATLDVITTKSRYVLKIDFPVASTIPLKLLGNIGYSIKAVIDLPDGGAFSFANNGEPLFRVEEGQSYEIKICNDCYEQKSKNSLELQNKIEALKAELSKADNSEFFEKLDTINKDVAALLEIQNTTDFAMLYNILEDKLLSGFRFSVVRDSRDMPKIPFGILIPDNTNPAPEEEGKPCHKTEVSDPDSTFP